MSVSLHPITPVWLAVILAVALCAVLVWIENSRPDKFKTPRIMAVFVLVISLLALSLRPALSGYTKTGEQALLTKGYVKRIADSLQRAVPNLRFLRTDDASRYGDADVINDHALAGLMGKDIRFVLGDGLSSAQLDLINEKRFAYFPSPAGSGILELSTGPYYANRINTIRGKFNNTGGVAKIKLSGEDSVTITKPGIYSFSLRFKSAVSGKFIYNLQVIAGGKATVERLPVEILSDQKMNILFIQQYPTAEVKYLRQYLEKERHAVVMRYAVSEGKYRYEYSRHERLVSTNLSNKWNSFDLAVVDAESVQKFTPLEKKSLSEALEFGFGLIIMYHGVPKTATSEDIGFKSARIDTLTMNISGKRLQLPAITGIAYADGQTETITSSTKGQPVSATTSTGAGKTGFQFLQDTWPVLLRGDDQVYARLWSPLIEATARNANRATNIRITSPFPVYSDDPIEAEVISSAKNARFFADHVPVPLRENALIDDLWQVKLWAGAAGWHQLTVDDDSVPVHYFAFLKSEWQSLSSENQRRQNDAFQNTKINGTATQLKIETPIPDLIFFIILIIAAALLWLLPKV